MFKSVLSKVGRGVRVVIHDPEVNRTGKAFATLIAVRLTLAITGSATLATHVEGLVKLLFG